MSASIDSFQDEDDEICPPLLVRIQTIDLQNLDFQTNIGSSVKFRHLTYVEATNLFLFVGSTSGTVYVFSRDTLKFLFIIPFKGGKVCSIACSQDESDIAVGSIRGKVSIYRISPNVHYMQSSASAPLIDAFREIYDVPHHVGSEITEMQWSPNGKYLFIGDSQGIVSQMDVACLDEFPRPIPSKVIMKLQARVLQIECSFPYLAICTLAAVFLCDLEKEDFTRVQQKKNIDIRSTGLCLMILPERSSLRDLAIERTIPSAKLMLFIGEVGSGTIHCSNMEGNILFSKKIQVSSKVSKYSMPLFEPTKPTRICRESGGEESEDDDNVNICLGKMLCTDDGTIVSTSSDRLFVYDPYTLNVIAWNEDFKRINNFKIISNYAFIWAGSKLEVVAFTPFRSYAEQLFRAKLNGVLENWILHAVCSLGWNFKPISPVVGEDISEDGDDFSGDVQGHSNASGIISPLDLLDENCAKAMWNFKKMMYSESDEESEFTQYVIKQLPFQLTLSKGDTTTETSPVEEIPVVEEETKRLEKCVRSFLSRVSSVLAAASIPAFSQLESSSDNHSSAQTQDNNRIASALSQILKKPTSDPSRDYFYVFHEIWKGLVVFYEDIGCTLPQLDYKKSDLTLSHVLNATQAFLSQQKLVNICEELKEIVDVSRFEEIAIQMMACLHSHTQSCAKKDSKESEQNPPTLCFTKFTQCPLVVQWYRELGTSKEVLFYDGLVADSLLLLLPLCTRNDSLFLSIGLDYIGIYDKLPKNFMTWIFLCRFLHRPKQVAYSPLLRSLLNDELFEKLAEEMFSTIYRDFRLSSFGNSAHYLHHFVSALVLLSKSPECGQPRSVSVLLSCFPLAKWAREDIVTKIIAACHINPSLLGLYLKACLEDGNSMKLCACGIQAGYGSLEGKISPWQRAIEEAIIKLLLEEYFKSSPYDDDDDDSEPDQQQDGNGNNTQNQKRRTEMLVHMFAMRRGLLEPYFRSPLPDEFISEEIQAELIVRSGSCASLKYYQSSPHNMSLLFGCYRSHFPNKTKTRHTHSEPRSGSSSVRSHKSKVVKSTGVQAIKLQCNNHNNKSAKSNHHGRKCGKCAVPLLTFTKDFKPFSWDCLGIWALKQVGSLERFMEVVQSHSHLNAPGTFSPRFYRSVADFNDGMHKGGLNSEYDLDSLGESSLLSCSNFH